jgi:ribosome recycling factor
MTTDINTFKEKLEDADKWITKELSSIRTGRATVTLLDGIMIEVYGTKGPINQSASINVEDAKSIRVVPWDKGIISEIESAISKAELGVSISSDADGVRVKFPDLTSETRELLLKQAGKKIEEAKIRLRNDRGEIIKHFENQEKEGNISKDELKREKDDIQKLIDDKVKEFDEKYKLKEQEIKA